MSSPWPRAPREYCRRLGRSARSGNLSVSERSSIATFWPSTKPASLRPWRKAVRRISERSTAENPDHRHRRLLRACTPCVGREQQAAASDQSDEVTPFYVEHGGLP